MIFIVDNLNTTGAQLEPTQYDPHESMASIGALAFRRPKRSGRNPATGSRNSRRYGISNVFITGYQPMYDSQGNPII